MKKYLIVLLTLCLIACSKSSIEPENKPNLRPLSGGESDVVKGSDEFAFNLFKNLQPSTPENYFISPFSVSMALGMTLNGASDQTQKSMISTIGLSGLTAEEINLGYKGIRELLFTMDRKIELGIVNSVWYSDQYTVKKDFASVVQENYEAKIQGLNFTSSLSKDVINGWVEDNTHKRIQNLLDNIDPAEVMFLVNAVYFKGNWTYQFDKSKTHDASFTTLEDFIVPVKMMFSPGVKLKRTVTNTFQILEVPYGNGQFNFVILLPNSANQFKEMMTSLSTSQVNDLSASADSLTVELELPRFTMKWKKNLLGDLLKMGMETEGFPKLFEEQLPLGISRVIHQAFLDVNEEGTEAAAAIAVGVVLTTTGVSVPPRITINRPFIFMIREKHTGSTLFIGQIVDPSVL